jgi:hypothetical protein
MRSLIKPRTLLLIAIISIVCSIYSTLPIAAAVPPPAHCVGIASDSNGDGHVTMQLPPEPDGQVGIIYIQPLFAVMRQQLDKLGLTDLTVVDRSLTATGLTASERTNYLKSDRYGSLIGDRCKFNMVGPFIPDVAANKATPDQYVAQLIPLVGGLIKSNPETTIFILSHYQTQRAEFTATNNGFGMRAERIDSFNAKLAESCAPNGPLGRIPQVVCLNTQSFFNGMGNSYLLIGADRAHFEELIFRPTGFRPTVEKYFAENPEGAVIGDGIHLGLAGRVRLTQRIAELISQLSDF